MFYMRRGLGLNPALIATANTALIHGDEDGGDAAEIYDSAHAGTFAINQHSWAQIAAEFHGYPYLSATFDQAVAAETALRTRLLNSIAAAFPPCPPDWEATDGSGCRGFTTIPTLYTTPAAPIVFLPIGTFSVGGVSFLPNEVKDGKYSRTVVPDAWQRADLELRAIYASTERLFGGNGVNWKERLAIGKSSSFLGDAGLIYSAIYAYAAIHGVGQTGAKFTTSSGIPTDFVNGLSVNDVLSACSDVMLYALNFERNPIQPSTAELTGKGGWISWLSRGGYPLSKAIIGGQSPVFKGLTPTFSVGQACACANGSVAGPYAFINGSGASATSGEDDSNWWVYYAWDQTKVSPNIQVTLSYQKASKWQAIGKAGEWAINEIMSILCSNQSLEKAKLSALAAEKCADATGKPCAKGAAGCTCTPPTTGQQASVGLVNGAAAGACALWAAENLPAPPPTLSPIVIPPPPPAVSAIPWWAVVTAGLGVGAYAFSRKSQK